MVNENKSWNFHKILALSKVISFFVNIFVFFLSQVINTDCDMKEMYKKFEQHKNDIIQINKEN